MGNITSVLDIVRETNRALHAGDEALQSSRYAAELADVLFLLRMPDRTNAPAGDQRSAQNAGHHEFEGLHGDEYRPLTDYITPASSNTWERLLVRPTGLIYSVLSTMGVLVIDLAKSFGSAFC